MFKNIYRAIIIILLLSGVQGFQNNGKSSTNKFWINLINQISKQTKNEINILINDVPPYSMLNKKRNHQEGSDVIILRMILDKLNLKASFTPERDFARISEAYLE